MLLLALVWWRQDALQRTMRFLINATVCCTDPSRGAYYGAAEAQWLVVMRQNTILAENCNWRGPYNVLVDVPELGAMNVGLGVRHPFNPL